METDASAVTDSFLILPTLNPGIPSIKYYPDNLRVCLREPFGNKIGTTRSLTLASELSSSAATAQFVSAVDIVSSTTMENVLARMDTITKSRSR
jgi:hypothetical protein